ncbi:MAG TPA: hypothetical protein VK504_10990, partial [Vicinamibacterales bacterium]|nr:hypothetical protein [Vicinamibacterales bacterium]
TGLVHNSGATALAVRTLPAAGNGKSYTYYVLDADGIKIQAGAGDTIRVITKVTASAGFVQSTTIGSTITLVAVGSVWAAISVHGNWTDGTFTYNDTTLLTP